MTPRRTIRNRPARLACGIALISAVLLHGAQVQAAEPGAPVETEVPAGTYALDKAHASLIFRVSHLGFSWFTARFTRWDATLDLDPDDPTGSTVVATIDPASIETDYPDPETYDFNADLRGESWFDTGRFPEMTFRSTAVTMTAPDTATVDGELTLHGVTAPVALEVTFNGGYASQPLDPGGSRIGFSARGSLSRTASTRVVKTVMTWDTV